MWNRDEIEGKGKQVKGKMKEAVGDLTDNDRLRDEGAGDNAEGSVQETLGKGKRKIGEAIEDVGKNIKR